MKKSEMSILNFVIEFHRGEFSIPLIRDLSVTSSSLSMVWWNGSVPVVRSSKPTIYLYPYHDRPYSFVEIKLDSVSDQRNVYWDCTGSIFLRFRFDKENNLLNVNHTIETCSGYYSDRLSLYVKRWNESPESFIIEPSYSPFRIVLRAERSYIK